MIVDGYITEIHMTGTFSQAIQWQAFALGKLRDLLRAGFRGQTVMEIGDVKLRVMVSRETKLAKVWVEAGGVQHGIVGILATTEHPQGGIDPANNRPTYKRLRIAMEVPKGATKGAPREPVRVTASGVTTDSLSKYGAWDWIYERPKKDAPGEFDLVGYLTWGTPEEYSGIDRTGVGAVTTPSGELSVAPLSGTFGRRVWLNRKPLVRCPLGNPMSAAIKHVTVDEKERKYLLLWVYAYDQFAYLYAPSLYAVDITAGFNVKKYEDEWKAKATRLLTLSKATFNSQTEPRWDDVRLRFNRSATRCSGVVAVRTPELSVGETINVVVHVDIESYTSASASMETPEVTGSVTTESVDAVYGGSDPPPAYFDYVDQYGNQYHSLIGYQGSYTRTYDSGYTTTSLAAPQETTLFIDYVGDEERRYTAVLEEYLSVSERMSTATGFVATTDGPSVNYIPPEWGFDFIFRDVWNGVTYDRYYWSYTSSAGAGTSTTTPATWNAKLTYKVGDNTEHDEFTSTGSGDGLRITTERFYWIAADPRYGFYAGYTILFDSETGESTYSVSVNGSEVLRASVAEPTPFSVENSATLPFYHVEREIWRALGAVVSGERVRTLFPRPALFSEFSKAEYPYTASGSRVAQVAHATDGANYDMGAPPDTFVTMLLPLSLSGPTMSTPTWVAKFGGEDPATVLETSERLPRLCYLGLV